MKVLVAPTAFKGTMSPHMVAQAIKLGLCRAAQEAGRTIEIVCLGLADGGDGTLEVTADGLGGQLNKIAVQDALGHVHSAHWLQLPEMAMVELASTCGIGLMAPDLRNPMEAHTYGLGQALAAALSGGNQEVICALGGSASTDGGAGALAALGARFYRQDGTVLESYGGQHLDQIYRIDLSVAVELVAGRQLVVLTDVTNPLTGPCGAAFVYAPQKGADKEQVTKLDHALTHFADRLEADCRRQWRNKPGAGAAGGTAFGLAALSPSIKFVPGFDWLFERLNLAYHLDACDLVVTGEGSFDAQSLAGKVTGRLLAAAHERGKSAWIVAAQSSSEMVSRTNAQILLPDRTSAIRPDDITVVVAQALKSRFGG